MLQILECRSFRNLDDLEWRPAAGRHLILGPNGAGKTSLLEAVYLVVTTRSFRTHRIGTCVRHGRDSFLVQAEVSTDRRSHLEVGWSAEGRYRALNGETGSLVEHLAVLPVVAWTASEGELLTGPPAVRRRFLDQGIVGLRPATLIALSRYRRALAQKRRLLSEGGSGLESWNEVLAPAAAEIVKSRSEYCERLSSQLRSVLQDTDLLPVDVEIRYRPSVPIEQADPESMLRVLDRSARDEIEARRPLVGPHLDELQIRWAGHGVREAASAGEKKALALALIAARGTILEDAGKEPIYLLDDVDTELDSSRLRSIWKVFSRAGQLFVSSNRPAVWEGLDIGFEWRLEAGRLQLPKDV